MTTLPRMLTLLLRSILLWLTLLAFPGLAAAAAQPCALHGQAAPMAMPMQIRMPMSAPATHPAAPAAVCHGGSTHADRHGGHAHDHCSACAACCAGVAPAPAITLAPRDPGAAFVAVPFRPGHLPSVDPFLLERPPRPAFA